MRSERRQTVDEIKEQIYSFFHIFNRVNGRFNFEISFYFIKFFLEFIAERAQEEEFNTHRSAPRSVYAFRKTKPKPKLDRCVNYCFCSHEFCLVFNRNEKKMSSKLKENPVLNFWLAVVIYVVHKMRGRFGKSSWCISLWMGMGMMVYVCIYIANL